MSASAGAKTDYRCVPLATQISKEKWKKQHFLKPLLTKEASISQFMLNHCKNQLLNLTADHILP